MCIQLTYTDFLSRFCMFLYVNSVTVRRKELQDCTQAKKIHKNDSTILLAFFLRCSIHKEDLELVCTFSNFDQTH